MSCLRLRNYRNSFSLIPKTEGAVYYLELALRELPEDRTRLLAIIRPTVFMIVLSWILIHGLTIPFFSFHHKVRRTYTKRKDLLPWTITATNTIEPKGWDADRETHQTPNPPTDGQPVLSERDEGPKAKPRTAADTDNSGNVPPFLNNDNIGSSVASRAPPLKPETAEMTATSS